MKRAFLTVTLGLVACVVGMSPANAATRVTVYSAVDAPAAANLPSVGPEAYAFKEFGDEVTLDGTARTLNTVSVTMSSWACEQGAWNTNDCYSTPRSTFTEPITLTIYDQATAQDDGTVVPGDLLTRATKTFRIPFRPRANLAHCRDANLGKWYNSADDTCYNGKAAVITYNFASLGITVPDTIVVGISYNTTSAGPHPIGTGAACYGTSAGCGYDSLNIGLSPNVNVGSKPYPNTAFQNTSVAGNLCVGAATGVFNLDSPGDPNCWAGYNPAIAITAH